MTLRFWRIAEELAEVEPHSISAGASPRPFATHTAALDEHADSKRSISIDCAVGLASPRAVRFLVVDAIVLFLGAIVNVETALPPTSLMCSPRVAPPNTFRFQQMQSPQPRNAPSQIPPVSTLWVEWCVCQIARSQTETETETKSGKRIS